MTAQEELYTRIMKDIEQLKTIQLTTLEAITTVEGLQREQQVIIDRVTRQVFEELDAFGKKKFTNETMRSVAVREELAGMEEYQQREKEIAKLETDIQKSKIEQEYLRKKITLNKEYIASLRSNED